MPEINMIPLLAPIELVSSQHSGEIKGKAGIAFINKSRTIRFKKSIRFGL